MRLGVSLLLVCAGCSGSARLLAEPPPSSAPDTQPDTQLDAAMARALREQAGRAHTHRLVWTGINGGLAVGSFAVLPALDRSSRPDFVVAGVGSVLGTVATFAFPLRVERDTTELDDAERLPPAARHQKLHELLLADAEDERARLALPWHVVNFGLSALAGGIIAVGFHHTLSGVVQGASSLVLGEAQLFTQPTGLTRFDPAQTATAPLALRPQVSIQNRSLSIGMTGIW